MTLLATYYPSEPGARTWREAKRLYVREHVVQVQLYDLGDGPKVAIAIGGAIPFEGTLPEGIVWGSAEFTTWVRDIAAQHAAALDAADSKREADRLWTFHRGHCAVCATGARCPKGEEILFARSNGPVAPAVRTAVVTRVYGRAGRLVRVEIKIANRAGVVIATAVTRTVKHANRLVADMDATSIVHTAHR